MGPAQLLDTSRILLGIDASYSKQEVIRLLIETAVAGGGAEEITTEILAREAKMTTGIGKGVAIPHARSKSVETPAAALGVAPGGIDFGALDDEPVRIVFAFVVPEYRPSLHIEALAKAVALFGDDGIRHDIVSAADPAEVLGILAQAGPI